MKILILISNYQREEMFKSLLNEIKNNSYHNDIDFFIVDDHSSYDISKYTNNFHKNEYNYGKNEYWKTFKYLLDYAKYKSNEYDQFIFTPNDFSEFDFDRIIKIMDDFNNEQYIFNLINDGRVSCWNSKKRGKIGDNLYKSYFTDCGFFCNKTTLLLLYINEVPKTRFERKDISSGVGQQLTNLIKKFKISTYHPVRSLCYHGEHKSTMHPSERLKNKLISR